MSENSGRWILLIVDDDQQLRQTVERSAKLELGDLGLDILTACSGQDGIDQLRKKGLESGDEVFVLSDFDMLGMTGLEFLVGLPIIFPDVRFGRMIFSGGSDHNRRSTERAGCWFIEKPFSITELFLHIHTFFGRK
ncbi:response regulator [Candidatus Uhrbacteria bacterium]|nr:response regulator [Candidatus Uhrbacteria bacterium]